ERLQVSLNQKPAPAQQLVIYGLFFLRRLSSSVLTLKIRKGTRFFMQAGWALMPGYSDCFENQSSSTGSPWMISGCLFPDRKTTHCLITAFSLRLSQASRQLIQLRRNGILQLTRLHSRMVICNSMTGIRVIT